MKHLIRWVVLAMAAATGLAAPAASTDWAALYTGAATGDADPGMSSIGNYLAYYCTASAAESVFGSSELADVVDSLTAGYDTGKAALASSGTAMTSADYAAGQYGFVQYAASALADSDYLAVVFYEAASERQFRVFGAGNAEYADGHVVFDDTESMFAVSDWTAAGGAVPEPTSGLLLLVGVSALALRRRTRR